jgi:histone-lysine N-methyltransferase SETMAR
LLDNEITAHATVATIQDLDFECLPHPPYSPDLAPRDYHMFGPLKEATGGKKFCSDEEVQQVVHEWLRRQPQEFFLEDSIHFVNAGGPVLNEMETM